MAHKKIHTRAGQRRDPEAWRRADEEAWAKKGGRPGGGGGRGGLASEIEAGPGGGGGAQRPIGVPAGYEARRPWGGAGSDIGNLIGGVQGRGGGTRVPARYFAGSEWEPAALPPAQIAALQRKMAAAGLYGRRGKYQSGVWRPSDAEAYSQVLAHANASGMDKDQSLDLFSRSGGVGDDDEGRQVEPLVIELPNPEDLRKTFNDVARNVIGRKLDDNSLGQMITAFTNQIAQTQRHQYQHQITGRPNTVAGTVVNPPNPQVYAEEEARRRDPAGAFAEDFGRAGEVWFDLLDETSRRARSVASQGRMR